MLSKLEKINSYLLSIKKVEAETAKLEEKLKLIAAEKATHEKESLIAEETIKAKELEVDNLAKDFEAKSNVIEEKIKELEKKIEDKQNEKELFFKNKELREKIKHLEQVNTVLTKTIEDMKEDTKDKPLETNISPDKMLDDFQKEIKVQFNGKYLKEATIASIIDATIKFFRNDFIEFTKKEREQRRKHLDDFEKYVEISLNLMEEVDNEIDKAQLKILQKLNISFDTFKDSLEYYLESQNEDILYMVMLLPQRLKMQIPSNKKLDKSTLKQVIRYQQQLVPKEYGNLAKLQRFQSQVPPERIALIFANKLADSVYRKYEVEEEDLISCVQDPSLMNDIEMMNLMMQLQQSLSMGPGMGGMGGPMGGPDDFGGPMGGMGAMGGMGGGFPGGFYQ